MQPSGSNHATNPMLRTFVREVAAKFPAVSSKKRDAKEEEVLTSPKTLSEKRPY